MTKILDDRTVELAGATVHVNVTRTEYEVGGQHFVLDRADVRAPVGGWGTVTARITAGSYFFALGRQDVTIGHAAFDDRYIVKTNAPDALAYWFDERVADAVLATYEPTALTPFAVELEPGAVLLSARGEALTDHVSVAGLRPYDERPLSDRPCLVRRIDEAVAAAAAIAGRGAALADAWRARLTPLGLVEAGPVWRTDKSYVAVVASGRTRVTLDFPWHLPAAGKDRLRTRLSIPWSGAAPPRAKETARATAGLDWFHAADQRLAVGWERIVEDPARLAAAIALLARWAEQLAVAEGPYR